MGAIVRAVLRKRLVGVVLVALAIAMLFGGSLAALAGADRSSSALAGLVTYSAPEDVFVARSSASAVDMAAVDALPEVLGTAYQEYLAMVPIGSDGQPQTQLAGSINPYLYRHGRDPNTLTVDVQRTRQGQTAAQQINLEIISPSRPARFTDCRTPSVPERTPSA